MDINGWNYLFENLPHWRIREHFPYVYDQLTQSVTGKYAILIYCFKSSYSENMMTSCAIMMNGRFSAPACCLWMRILFIILISMMMAKSWNHKYRDG